VKNRYLSEATIPAASAGCAPTFVLYPDIHLRTEVKSTPPPQKIKKKKYILI